MKKKRGYMLPWIDRCGPYILLLKHEFITLLEDGDVGMVEPLNLRCEGLEVLGNFCPLFLSAQPTSSKLPT